MSVTNSKELNALINLIDDPDTEISKHVTEKLISFGPSIIPNLEEASEKPFNPVVHSRLKEVIHIIHRDTICSDLKEWATNYSEDLLQGAVLVARYQYPDIHVFKIQNHIDKLKKEIWLEMNYNLTPLEQVNVFNHVLYGMNDFRSSDAKENNPNDCYINCLLESKKGNSISLGILYLILSGYLQMPVYGINLPDQFVLSYHNHLLQPDDDEQSVRSSILFYINSMYRGAIFSREDITQFLIKTNHEPKPQYYVPCSNIEVINLLMDYLISGYEKEGANEKVSDLEKMKKALK